MALSYGIEGLDAATGGLKEQELLLIAGRPAVGKTALATQLAVAAAMGGATVLWFSLEHPSDYVAYRLLRALRCARASRSVFIAPPDRVVDENLTGSVRIIDDPVQSALSVWESLRRESRNARGTLVIVDCIQLMTPSKDDGRKYFARHERCMKELRDRILVPGVSAVVLSGLPHSVDRRENRRPLLSDLRKGGADLGEYADTVLLFQQTADILPSEEQSRNGRFRPARIIVAKQPHKPETDVDLELDTACSWTFRAAHQ